MKKLILSLTMMLATLCTKAQGKDYYLPMTGIEFIFEVSRKGPIDNTEYAFVSVRTSLFGLPDESKHYKAVINKKNSIEYICKSDEGILLGVNKNVTQPKQEKAKEIKERTSSQPDIVEISVIYVPVKEVERVPLCHLLSDQGVFIGEGDPAKTYYLTIKDNHDIYNPQATVKMSKAGKDNPNINVNLPGKATMIIEKGENFISSQELYLGQFGRVEAIDSKFFSKDSDFTLELSPITGGIKLLK